MRPIQVGLLAVCGLAAGCLFGCVADGNSRGEVGDLRVGDGSRALVVKGLGAGMDAAGQRPETSQRDDGPSLDGLSRAHWERTTVLVPVDGVEGTPRYLREHPRTQSTARQRGEYPTEVTALELSGDNEDAQVQEVLAAPLWNLIQATLLLPRMAFVEPWQQTRHLPDQYWRAPTSTARETLVDAAQHEARVEQADRQRIEDGRVIEVDAAPGSNPMDAPR